MIKKTLIAAAIAACVATPASAADLGGASYDAPASWRGFYLGLGVGAGAVQNEVSLTTPLAPVSAKVDSFGGDGIFGTVQLGYDFQLGTRIVAGVFADYDFGDQKAEVSANLGGTGISASLKKKNSWAIGGRVGVTAGNTLWYVPVGYTQAEIDLSIPGIAGTGFNGYSKNNDHSGWFVGAGVETKFDRLSLKLEYRYSAYDAECLYCEAGLVDVKNEPREHSARMVAAYKFDFGHRDVIEPLK